MTHRMVAFDTEFPGVVFSPMNIDKRELGKLPSSLNYNIIRDNVGATKIIQLGLALCDDKGSLPNFGTKYQYTWSLTSKILKSIMTSKTRNQSSYSKARESISTRT